MGRKSVVLGAVLLSVAVLLACRAWGQTNLDADVIKAALRTAQPEEDGFVARVVKLANDGKLPADMVERTFAWARNKPKHKFQYFKRALIIQAADIGISL